MNKRFLEEKLIRTYIHWTGKKEILPFVIAWMDMEIIILSEVTVRERQIPYDLTYLWNLLNKIN